MGDGCRLGQFHDLWNDREIDLVNPEPEPRTPSAGHLFLPPAPTGVDAPDVWISRTPSLTPLRRIGMMGMISYDRH